MKPSEQDEWAKISYGNKRRLMADDYIGPGLRRVGVLVSKEPLTVKFPDGDTMILRQPCGAGADVGDYYYDGGRDTGLFHGKSNFEANFHNDFTVKTSGEHWNEDCLVVNQPHARLASQEVRRLGMIHDHGKPNNFATVEGTPRRVAAFGSIGNVGSISVGGQLITTGRDDL